MDFYPSLLERLTIRLAGKGWHLPAYWSLTLGTFPLATYLYNKESAGARHHLKNIVVVLLLASGVFFAYVFRLYILYIILVAAGRILGTLHHLIASYGLGERPRLGLLSVMPFFYYSIQSIFIRLYGKFFKIPFIFATCGMGPLVLWSWEKGKRMKALSWALSILGIVLLVYIGYALALLFMALGMLFFLAVYIVKAIGGEQEIVHDFPKQEGRWEWAGVAFLAFITISFAANLNKFSPNVIDLWYHLAIARKILELGTIPLWDFWEFAPAGRPHLYPPLSHLLIALFSGSPDNVIQGGRYLQALTYPLTLITTWYFSREFFGSKVATLAVFFLSMGMGVMLISTMALPSCLVTLMLPLLILAFVRGRIMASILLLTAMLYSHLSFPFVVIFTLFLISFKYREYMRAFTIVACASLALYVPWLFRVLANKGAFSSTTDQLLSLKGMFIGLLSLQIVNPLLLILGIVAFLRIDDSKIETKAVKIVIMGTLPILLFYGGRYWLHIVPFWAICIAIYLKDKLINKKRLALVAIAMLIPSISIMTTQWPPVMINLTGTDAAIIMWTNEDGIIFDKQYDTDCDELAAYLEANLPEDAIVSSYIEWVPDMIVTLTDLRTDRGAWWEVKSNNENVLPDAFITFEEIPGSTRIGRFFVTTDKDIILSLVSQSNI